MKKLIAGILLSIIIGCQPAFGVVNTTAVPERFPANGSATTFNFNMRLTDQTELQAVLRADSTGIDTPLTLNVDYTLSATNNDFSSGGTLTTVATHASGNTLILHREALRTQTVNLIQGQSMPAEATETTFDKQTMAIQDVDKNLIFYISVPKGDPTTALDLELPSSIDRADRNMTFDSNGSVQATASVGEVTVSAYAETYLDDTSEAAFKATTNLEAGTDFHAYTTNGNTILTDAGVLSIAGLTTAADKMIYTTAADVYASTDLTATGRALIDDASTSAQRTTLGLAIGINVQAWDAQLDDIAALAVTNSNFIVGDGANWVAESGVTVRTSLGLAIGTDVQAFDAELLAIAGLTSAADKMLYFTGSETAATTDLTSFARTMLDDADAAAVRTTIGAAAVGGQFTDRGDPAANDFQVGDLTTDGTWNDLDLSSIVSAGATGVVLKLIIQDGATASEMIFRKNGNSNALAVAGAQTQVANISVISTVTIPCDSGRIIEYRGSNLTFGQIDITVLGWWE